MTPVALTRTSRYRPTVPMLHVQVLYCVSFRFRECGNNFLQRTNKPFPSDSACFTSVGELLSDSLESDVLECPEACSLSSVFIASAHPAAATVRGRERKQDTFEFQLLHTDTPACSCLAVTHRGGGLSPRCATLHRLDASFPTSRPSNSLEGRRASARPPAYPGCCPTASDLCTHTHRQTHTISS